MKIFAIIKLGIIVNVIVWDGVTPWTAPEQTQAVVEITQSDKQKTIGIDDLYDGVKFTKAPPKNEDPVIEVPVEEPILNP